MILRNPISRICACLVLLSAPLFGQGSFEVRLLAFGPDQKIGEVYIQDPAQADGTSVKSEVKSYLNHQFSTVILKGRKMAFTSGPDRGSLTREGEVLAEATIPENVKSSILLFLPSNPGAKFKYQVMAVPDSKRSFPAGSYYVANLSSTQLRLVLEEKVFDFKPGKSELIDDLPNKTGGQIGMRAVAFTNNVWKEVSSSIWNHPGRGRTLMIIYPGNSGGVQLRGFDDIPPREPSQPTAAN